MRHHNYKQQERNFELQSEEEMENLIFIKGASGKIVVMGTLHDYSHEIDKNLIIHCYQPEPGYCACVLQVADQ